MRTIWFTYDMEIYFCLGTCVSWFDAAKRQHTKSVCYKCYINGCYSPKQYLFSVFSLFFFWSWVYTYTMTERKYLFINIWLSCTKNIFWVLFYFAAESLVSSFSAYQHLTMLSFFFPSCMTVVLMFLVVYVQHNLKKGSYSYSLYACR